MPTGLRAADAPLIQRILNGDLRLLMRVGALLQQRLTFTEAALGALVSDGRTALIQDRTLATIDAEGFATLAATHQATDLILTVEPDGLRVIALADEIGNPLLAALAPPPEPEIPVGLPAVVASLAPSLRSPVEGLLSARADDQRAAALEQLRYAMPPLPVVCELMPMLLADGAETVRERAIALLVASGAHTLVVDAIRALQRGDDAALHRVSGGIGHLARQQQDLVIAALLAQLARGQAVPSMVALAQALAVNLARHPSLERLVELLLPRRLSLIDLVRSLQEHDRERIDSALRRNLGIDADQDSLILILLAVPGDAPDDAGELVHRGLDLLLSPEAAPRERMALAAALRRLDARACARGLAARHEILGRSPDTSAYWLIAELCRDNAIVDGDAEVLSRACRRLLRDGSSPHVVALLEQQLPALLPASPAMRLSLVEPVVASVTRFHDDRSQDVAAGCVLAIGAPAIDPLWSAIEDHPRSEVRSFAITLVPQLVSLDQGHAVPSVARLLTLAARTNDGEERAGILEAAATILLLPVLADEQTLHHDALTACGGLGDRALGILGLLAAAPACSDTLRGELVQRLLRTLDADVPDSPDSTELDSASQEVTYILDDALTRHTDAVPRVLAGLERVVGAAATPPPLASRIIDHLCRQWRRVSAWQVVWGPGNIRELGECLARLAERPACPPAQRVLCAEALLSGVGQLPIARALARVFLAGSGSYLATLAGRAAARLTQLAGEDYFADDEREELTEALVDLLAIPSLGKEDQSMKKRILHLVLSRPNDLSSRARARLRFLRGELPAEMAERLSGV